MRDDHRCLAGLISGLSLKIITGKTRLIERHCSRLRKRSRAGKAQALRLGRKDPWRSDRRDPRIPVPKHSSRGEEVADVPDASERLVRASNVIDVDGRRGTPRAARFQDDHRLGGAGRAGHHDDAAARGPFDLTHHPAGQATLTARAREPGEAIDIDERPVHAAVGSRQRASLLTRQARAVVMRCGAHMRVRHC